MSTKIAILPGDGIGPEIINEAVKVLECLQQDHSLDVELETAAIGGAAYDESGSPLPESTLNLCKSAEAILLGAVGGPQYESLERELRPEKGLL
ncbi:MAG: 3-isopropylmalate dehydrogenase, partial [Gammaproteobacteria bacterium]|nr:3-isopropylmalate dehydrogenase [Gammaproteobacteria bacterium]